MRLLVAALAGFAVAVVPAFTADHSITSVAGARWSPATLEIAEGDRVIWSNGDGGYHNVSFDDGSYTQPPAPASVWPTEVSRVFNTPGTYTYVCDAHSNMKGTIVVKGADGGPGTTSTQTTTGTTTSGTTGTTSTQTTTSATTTGTTGTTPAQTTTGTTTTGATTTGTTTTEQRPPPPVVSVKPIRSRFCARPSRRCRRAGIYLRITSDTPHRAVGRLRRNGRAFGTVAFDLPEGTTSVRFTRTSAGRRITRGNYSLKLGTAPVVRFRIIQPPVDRATRPGTARSLSGAVRAKAPGPGA